MIAEVVHAPELEVDPDWPGATGEVDPDSPEGSMGTMVSGVVAIEGRFDVTRPVEWLGVPAVIETDGTLADVNWLLDGLWGSRSVALESLETGEVVTIGMIEDVRIGC